MNIQDLLSSHLLPISSATLSLFTALISVLVTRKSYRKLNSSAKKLRVKINDRVIKLDDFDEKEMIALLEKLSEEKKENKKGGQGESLDLENND